jgi:hypothetical protein
MQPLLGLPPDVKLTAQDVYVVVNDLRPQLWLNIDIQLVNSRSHSALSPSSVSHARLTLSALQLYFWQSAGNHRELTPDDLAMAVDCKAARMLKSLLEVVLLLATIGPSVSQCYTLDETTHLAAACVAMTTHKPVRSSDIQRL